MSCTARYSAPLSTIVAIALREIARADRKASLASVPRESHQIRAMMSVVAITLVQSGSEYPASVSGSIGLGGVGVVGSSVTT